METLVWLVAGSLIGWLSFSYLGFNEARGVAVTMVIGAVGALIGGKVIAPMFTAATDAGGRLQPDALLFALGGAIGGLVLGDMLHRRWACAGGDHPRDEPDHFFLDERPRHLFES